MFLGHFALGLAAKRVDPRLSLGTTFAAVQFLDLLWPVFVLAGVEQVAAEPGNTRVTGLAFLHYPWSHSLVMAVAWAVLFAGLLLVRRRPLRAALLAGGLVVSHFLLDWISHRPDLPIVPGSSTLVGLGLWNSFPGTLLAEFGLFLLGVLSYLRTTVARDRAGSAGLVGLLAFLVVVYVASLLAPPAPGTPGAAIAGPALAMWLLVVWAAWVDRHRSLRAYLPPRIRTPSPA
jgi:hypothetical protein